MVERKQGGVPESDGLTSTKSTALPKRFYKNVSVAPDRAQAAILLDGRPLRTPGKVPLAVPARILAEAIADEWRRQGDHIDPRTMPLTRLANTAIDGVVSNKNAVVADILAHARADLLCYRASGPEGLLVRQAEHWDPVIAWANDALGAPLNLAEGIVHVDQPEGSISAFAEEIGRLDTFQLTALHVITALTGSALLALAVAKDRLRADAAWTAAHVDEDWQISQWGEDAEAKARREARKAEFDGAVRMLALSNA